MKRYLVFAWYNYSPGPSGGWQDFVSAHEMLEEAISAARVADGDFREVVDLETLAIVWFD